jgi:hypothetical protein
MNLRMTHREPHHISSLPIKTPHRRTGRTLGRSNLVIEKSVPREQKRSPRGGLSLTFAIPRRAESARARVCLAHVRAPAGMPIILGPRVVVNASRRVDPYDIARRARRARLELGRVLTRPRSRGRADIRRRRRTGSRRPLPPGKQRARLRSGRGRWGRRRRRSETARGRRGG